MTAGPNDAKHEKKLPDRTRTHSRKRRAQGYGAGMGRLLVVAAAVASVTLAGCGTTGPSTTVIDISLDDVLKERTMSRDVTLAVGDTLKLSLGANNSTSFRWTDPLIGDPAILRETGQDYTHLGNMPGSPGKQEWRFKAQKTGTTTIMTVYAQNWAGNTPPTCTVTTNVTVQ